MVEAQHLASILYPDHLACIYGVPSQLHATIVDCLQYAHAIPPIFALEAVQ